MLIAKNTVKQERSQGGGIGGRGPGLYPIKMLFLVFELNFS